MSLMSSGREGEGITRNLMLTLANGILSFQDSNSQRLRSVTFQVKSCVLLGFAFQRESSHSAHCLNRSPAGLPDHG